MTREEYYSIIKVLAPSNGEMPISYKKRIVDFLKKHPEYEHKPASDKELGAIFKYLNARCMEVDILGDKPGFVRYKDALLCMNFENTQWILLERNPEEQLWDLWEYINTTPDKKFSKNMSNIYTLK